MNILKSLRREEVISGNVVNSETNGFVQKLHKSLGASATQPGEAMTPREEALRTHERNIQMRRHELNEASKISAHAIRLGVSNMPHDCRIWGADWREHLPDGHPAKASAISSGTLVVMGSPRYTNNLLQAHKVMRNLDDTLMKIK
jgi:hypothetical protein